MAGTSDFFGLNFYTGYYGKPGEEGPTPSLDRDAGFITTQDPAWPSSASSWLKVSIILCEISGSHECAYEDDCLLGRCAVQSGRN